MLAPLIALVWVWLAQTATQPISKMTLKNGTVYLLKEPPRISGGRIIFTTMEGKIYSLSESEVDSIGFVPKPTPSPRVTYNPQDSRALGAIARQQRERREKKASVSPRPAASARRARPTRTPRTPPVPSRTPAPTTGTKSRG